MTQSAKQDMEGPFFHDTKGKTRHEGEHKASRRYLIRDGSQSDGFVLNWQLLLSFHGLMQPLSPPVTCTHVNTWPTHTNTWHSHHLAWSSVIIWHSQQSLPGTVMFWLSHYLPHSLPGTVITWHSHYLAQSQYLKNVVADNPDCDLIGICHDIADCDLSEKA